MITDGVAVGYAVLEIPCGRQPLYESRQGERVVKKGKEEPDVIEERGNEEQTELLCPVTTRKVVISHED